LVSASIIEIILSKKMKTGPTSFKQLEVRRSKYPNSDNFDVKGLKSLKLEERQAILSDVIPEIIILVSEIKDEILVLSFLKESIILVILSKILSAAHFLRRLLVLWIATDVELERNIDVKMIVRIKHAFIFIIHRSDKRFNSSKLLQGIEYLLIKIKMGCGTSVNIFLK